MIFFFDRSVGIGFPRALRTIKKFPLQVEYHQQHFKMEELDDVWLPEVGKKDWFVIGQDFSYHKNATELAAIRDYNIGVFYLWGANAPQWDAVRVFAKTYDKIVEKATTTPRPFVFWVRKDGKIVQQPLP